MSDLAATNCGCKMTAGVMNPVKSRVSNGKCRSNI